MPSRATERAQRIIYHLKKEEEEDNNVDSLLVRMETSSSSQNIKTSISTHVLDTARGVPANGLSILIERQVDSSKNLWEVHFKGITNSGGYRGTFILIY